MQRTLKSRQTRPAKAGKTLVMIYWAKLQIPEKYGVFKMFIACTGTSLMLWIRKISSCSHEWLPRNDPSKQANFARKEANFPPKGGKWASQGTLFPSKQANFETSIIQWDKGLSTNLRCKNKKKHWSKRSDAFKVPNFHCRSSKES